MAVRSFFHSSASLAGSPEAITLGKSSTRGLDCNCKVLLITIITIIGYQNETVVNHCKTNKQRVQQTSYWHNKSSWSNTYVHEGHAGLESSNLLQYGEFSSVLELEQFNVEFRLLRTPVTNAPVSTPHALHASRAARHSRVSRAQTALRTWHPWRPSSQQRRPWQERHQLEELERQQGQLELYRSAVSIEYS